MSHDVTCGGHEFWYFSGVFLFVFILSFKKLQMKTSLAKVNLLFFILMCKSEKDGLWLLPGQLVEGRRPEMR